MRDRGSDRTDAKMRRWAALAARCLPLAPLLVLSSCGGAETVAAGEIVTLAEAGASNPTVAITADGGSTFVAWVGEGNNVYLARLNDDGTPEGDPVRVNDIEGDADPHEQAPAQVALGPGSEVYVIWQRKVEAPWLEFGGADLRLARSEDGGRTFAPAITVNDNDPASPARISFHNIVVASDGKVHVSWIDARERDHVRELAYHGGDHAMHHMGSMSMAGAHGEPGTEMRIATSIDGGRTFSPSLVIDGDSCPCCRTAVAVGQDGAVYTAWRKIFDGGIRDIAIARSDDHAESFGQAHAVHADGWEFNACPHAGPSLAVDEAGRLHATWYSGADERQGLWYSFSTDGGETFATPVAVLSDDWVPPSQARLAAAGGSVFVAWDDLRDTDRKVRLGRIRDGRVIPLGAPVSGKAPSLAAAGARGAVAWLDGESVRAFTFEQAALN